MDTFTIKLAGIPIGVSCLYASTAKYCSKYKTEEPPLFCVEVTGEDVQYERGKAAGVDDGTIPGMPGSAWSDPYLETLALYRKTCTALVDYDVLLFHGSAICVDGQGYLFTAKSGTGKSTHAALWREVLPAIGHSVIMVNDDKPLLKFTKEQILVCGTPWSGKHHLDTDIMVGLRTIGQIVRSSSNHVEEIKATDCFPLLMTQCFLPGDPEKATHTLALLDRLCRDVKMKRIYCTKEREAALVSWVRMAGKC